MVLQRLPPAKRQIFSVRRPRRRIVFETVVGEALDLTLQIHHPEIGAFIRSFVALMGVRGQGQRAAIRPPGNSTDVHAEMRQLRRRSAVAGDDVQLRRRRGLRIARIGKIASPVRAIIDPVKRFSFEPLGELLFERRKFLRRRGWRGPFSRMRSIYCRD